MSGAPAARRRRPATRWTTSWRRAPPRSKPTISPIRPPSRSNCLKGDFDAVFDLYLDLLHNPEFREDKLELAKQQMYTGISRRNDERRLDRASRERSSSATARTIPMRACPSTPRSRRSRAQDLRELAPAVRASQQHHLRDHRATSIPRQMEAKLRAGLRVVAERARRRKRRRSSSPSPSPAITW